MEDKHSSNTILYLSFSYDNSFLLVGTESGFKIYNTCPLKMKFERSIFYLK